MRMRLCLAVTLALAASTGSGLSLSETNILQFSSLAFTVKESTPLAKIVVKRLGRASGTVTVDFETDDNNSGGNATAMQDYIPTNGTLTFGPGVTSRYFYVPILNDTAHEDDETVVLKLLNPSENATLGGQPNTTLTIQDNDPCSYELSPAGRVHDEVGGLASFDVIAPTGCQWTTEKTVDWIGIFSGASGNGNGTITYVYDPLPGDIASRTGSIRVGGKTFAITQRVPPADLTPPAITVLTPPEGSRQTNSSITVTGRATDEVGVTAVEVRLENSAGNTPYAPANGTDNWSATIDNLLPGSNTIRVRALDAASNIQEAARSILYVPVSPITLTANGNGTISGLKNGQVLDVGKTYVVQARAASGHFFSTWSGSLDSAENPLSFEMGTNFALQANFVSSPFTAVAGTYSGLLYETNVTHHESSGSLNVTVGGLGTFSAKVIVGGSRSSFSGRFGLDGKATNSLPRRDATNLIVVLCLDLIGGSDLITGSADHGDWQAPVVAYRDVYDTRTNPAPQAGRYTVIIPGDVMHADTQPGGDGYGALQVGADGTAKLSGALADGTKISAKAPLSKDGYWPLYLSIYGGQGSVVGWLLFAEVPDMSDVSGPLSWFKPAGAGTKYYPTGFAIQPTLSGSRYFAPSNEMGRVLSVTTGRLAFAAGNLPESFENTIALSASGVVTNLSTNKLAVSIQKTSGLLTGTVTGPGATRSTAFRGAVHQKGRFASGFFFGTNQTGRAHLSE